MGTSPEWSISKQRNECPGPKIQSASLYADHGEVLAFNQVLKLKYERGGEAKIFFALIKLQRSAFSTAWEYGDSVL
jgi:hypothetical protein